MTPATRNDLAENIRHGHGLGWSFTPLAGKRPTLKAWQSRPRESLDEALDWAARGNVGLRTGANSGIVVIDADAGADLSPLDLPGTASVTTGKDGLHLYYRCSAPVGNSAGRLGAHIDVRGDGGQVVYPGSVHPDTGRRYEWAEGFAPWEVEIAELPPHILARLTAPPAAAPAHDAPTTPPRPPTGRIERYAAAALRREIDTLLAAPEGTRNNALNEAAFSLGTLVGGGHLDRATAERELQAAAQATGLTPDEVEATIRSGLDSGARQPRRIESRPTHPAAPATTADTWYLTDLGNAARLVKQHGDDLRYCGPWGRWLIWDGTRWRPDDALHIMHTAKTVALSIFDEASQARDAERQQSLAKWACKSQARERLAAMVDLARCEVAVLPDALDADAWLLNCLNGTIDLRAGTLRPHERKDFLTKLAPVEFDPDAQAPRWTRFLNEITAGNAALTEYLQQIAGYGLTADVREQVLFIFHGCGANGKSVFLDTLCGVLGEYAGQAAPSLLVQRRNDEHPCEVADLMGKRLVISSETEEGGRLKIQFLKRLTGDARQKARFMRQDYFEFLTTYKLILCTNHRPKVGDDTFAAWRRLRLVPFGVIFPPEEQDPELLAKLRPEWPGILTWAVRGCLAWQRGGLRVPPEAEAATADYREEQDPLAEFISERLVFAVRARISRAEVYGAYLDWVGKARESYPLDRTALFDRLRRIEGISEAVLRWNGRSAHSFVGVGLMTMFDRAETATGLQPATGASG